MQPWAVARQFPSFLTGLICADLRDRGTANGGDAAIPRAMRTPTAPTKAGGCREFACLSKAVKGSLASVLVMRALIYCAGPDVKMVVLESTGEAL